MLPWNGMSETHPKVVLVLGQVGWMSIVQRLVGLMLTNGWALGRCATKSEASQKSLSAFPEQEVNCNLNLRASLRSE